jgi:hypothetical protein
LGLLFHGSASQPVDSVLEFRRSKLACVSQSLRLSAEHCPLNLLAGALCRVRISLNLTVMGLAGSILAVMHAQIDFPNTGTEVIPISESTWFAGMAAPDEINEHLSSRMAVKCFSKFQQQLRRVANFGGAEHFECLTQANKLAERDFARGGEGALGSYPVGLNRSVRRRNFEIVFAGVPDRGIDTGRLNDALCTCRRLRFIEVNQCVTSDIGIVIVDSLSTHSVPISDSDGGKSHQGTAKSRRDPCDNGQRIRPMSVLGPIGRHALT